MIFETVTIGMEDMEIGFEFNKADPEVGILKDWIDVQSVLIRGSEHVEDVEDDGMIMIIDALNNLRKESNEEAQIERFSSRD